MEMKKCTLCARPRTKNEIRICDHCQKRIVDEMIPDSFIRNGIPFLPGEDQ